MGSYSGLFKMHHYLSVEILIFSLLFFMLVSAYSALKLVICPEYSNSSLKCLKLKG